VSPYVRMVRMASGATAVQTVHFSRAGVAGYRAHRVGSRQRPVEGLKAAVRQPLAAGQDKLAVALWSGPTASERWGQLGLTARQARPGPEAHRACQAG
jgi:hypothetical protein